MSDALRSPWWRSRAPVWTIAALWALAILLVDPRGDFPLNDDWCYAQAVRHLLQEGEIRLTDWGSMALLTQVLWGAAFSLPYGFSFEALRASTLTLGLAALLCSYGIFRELGARQSVAFLATLTLLANPLFLMLAHTFMTDVPFLAFSIAALLLLVRGFERASIAALAAGLILALAATFVRQLGMALFVGFALALLSRGWRNGRRWIAAWAPFAGALGLLRLYEAHLASRHTLPENYYLQWRTIHQSLRAGILEFVGDWLATCVKMAIYVGLFVLPLAAIWAVHAGASRRRDLGVVLGWATVATIALAADGRLVPYFPNIFLNIDCDTPRVVLGPLTLRDGCAAVGPGLGELGPLSRWILTWLGIASAGSLLAVGVAWTRERRNAQAASGGAVLVLLVTTGASYLALIALIPDVFDRYMLFGVPLALAAFVGARDQAWRRRPSYALSGAVVLGMLLFSLGATQEYLAWNRARWRAITHLQDVGARRDEIDAGFEFGGWVNFDARFRSDRKDTGWWVVDDRYLVAFTRNQGYRVIARFPYRGWFGLTEDDVLAMRRSRRRASRPATPPQ